MANSPKRELKLAQSVGLPIDRFPETIEEASKVEELLARELAKLSFEEHEKIVFEVHGIAPLLHEEEESMVEKKLEELDHALNQVPVERKEAYILAAKLNPSYVHSRKFRMMFLRCHEFDCDAAADLIVQHFEEKRRLFGEGEVLARDVRQSDLSEEGRIILESGSAQVLQTRDAAGRRIVLMSSAGIREFPKGGWDEKNEFRAIWYLSMAMLRDEEAQKRGSVWVLMNTDSYKVSIDSFRNLYRMETSIPERLMGGHYCYTDPALRPYVAGIQLFICECDRNRLRTHFGTREEIEFALQTFGIPVQDFPVSMDGSFSNVAHREYLAVLRAQEEKDLQLPPNVTTESSGCMPRRFDVLFGKSSFAREHTGTLRALFLVQMHFSSYEKLGKYQKTDVADTIISIIHESGGRFLKQNESGIWREVSDVEARKKVAHWFRHARTKKCNKDQCPSKKPKHTISDNPPLMHCPSINEADQRRNHEILRIPCVTPENPVLSLEYPSHVI